MTYQPENTAILAWHFADKYNLNKQDAETFVYDMICYYPHSTSDLVIEKEIKEFLKTHNIIELVEIKHISGEWFKVNFYDLRGDENDLIPPYELNGNKRSRADAWLGSGRPSDIQRGKALQSYDEIMQINE